MISGGDIKNKVVEKVDNKIVKKVDINICKLTIKVEKVMINSVAANISDKGPLLFCIKKFDKNLCDGSSFIFDSLRLTNGDELEDVNLIFLNE